MIVHKQVKSVLKQKRIHYRNPDERDLFVWVSTSSSHKLLKSAERKGLVRIILGEEDGTERSKKDG